MKFAIKFKFVVFFTLFSGVFFAQQLPQFSQYLQNQAVVNPGSVGKNDFRELTLSGRAQWVGFSNAPVTSYLLFSSLIRNKSKKDNLYNPGLHISNNVAKDSAVHVTKVKHAVGGQFIADQYGAFRRIQVSGVYAVHLPITKKFNISFGTKLGVNSNTFLPDRAVVNNPTIDITYNAITSNQSNTNYMNLGVGLYLYSKDLFFGISGDQLTKDMVSFGSGTAKFDNRTHYNFTGGVNIKVNNDFTITPAFFLKYMAPVVPVIEGTVKVEYKESIWTALSYRNKDAIIAMFGMNISHRFKLGYSYDFSVSKFKNYSSGGHEIVLRAIIGN